MGLKVNLGKSRVLISSSIRKEGMCKGEVDPCCVCILIVKTNSALCVQCDKLIHDTCARVNWVSPKFSGSLTCRKCEGNIGEVVEQEEKLCDEVESAREFTYLCNRFCAGGGCEAAAIVIT